MSAVRRWLRRHDRWIPLCFVAFFLVVFAVNGVLVTVAFKTFNGLTTDHAYARGLAWNQVVAAQRAQAALGWTAAMAFEPDGPRAGRLQLQLRDSGGTPVVRALASARFVRPTVQGHDVEIQLAETGPGRYAARVELGLPGLWEVRIEAVRGADSYIATDRLMVR